MHNFRTYFFALGEVNASISNLLTTANNYRKLLSDFFQQKSNLALSICMHKHAENCSFLVLRVQKIWHKIVTFSAPNILNPLPATYHAPNHKQCLALRPKIPKLKRFGNN